MNMNVLISWLITFGDQVEVIEPLEVKEEVEGFKNKKCMLEKEEA